MKVNTLYLLFRAALAAAFARGNGEPPPFRIRRHSHKTQHQGAPKPRLHYPHKRTDETIAGYDHAVSLWLEGGRIGPKPSRFMAPNSERADRLLNELINNARNA